MVPVAPAAIAVTMENVSVDDGFIVPKLQLTFPLAPTAGVVQLAPGGVLRDTNVVWEGVGATTVTLVPALLPELLTT